MTTFFQGSGSSIANALTASGATGLSNARILNQGLAITTLGSADVFFNVVSDPRVPRGTILSGVGGTAAKALTASGISAITNPRIQHLDVGIEGGAGSVTVLATISNKAPACSVTTGTGSTITHAVATAGLSAATHPRLYKIAMAKDSTGSVTAIIATTGDENIPK